MGDKREMSEDRTVGQVKPDYQYNDVTLYLGDCLEVMHAIEDNSADAIIADLPYGTTACKWDQVIPFEPLWEHFKRLLKPHGAVVLFGSQPFTTDLINSNRKWFKYEWIWNKLGGGAFIRAKTMPLKRHESILVFSNDWNMVYNPCMTVAAKNKISGANNGSSGSLPVYARGKSPKVPKIMTQKNVIPQQLSLCRGLWQNVVRFIAFTRHKNHSPC